MLICNTKKKKKKKKREKIDTLLDLLAKRLSVSPSRPICRTNVDATAMTKRCHRTDEDINRGRREKERQREREKEKKGKEGTAITRVTRVTDN